MDPVSDYHVALPPAEYRWQTPSPKFQDRVWLHALLFVLTAATTTLAGANYYANWITEIGQRDVTLSFGQLYAHGLWFSVSLLAILMSHELGHYFACRYYDVDASLPYFLPMPLVPTGTMGAVIRIREPILSKRLFFDIGIAGPIAGFVVAVAAMVIGLAFSSVVRFESHAGVVEFADPPIFQLASWILFGHVDDGYSINLHPVGWAAWWGFFVTALNLFPVGQLDGGHVAYAVIGRQSSWLTLIALACGAALSLVSANWIGWTIVMTIMLLIFGRHHPQTIDESVPLNAARVWLALFALAMFVLSFAPATITQL